MTLSRTPADRAQLPSQQRSSAGTQPARRPAVRLELEVVDPVTGSCTRRLEVDDEVGPSPAREADRRLMAVFEDMLRLHPEWPTPRVVDGEVDATGNPVGEWFYSSPALREWRQQLVPSAMALFPVQRDVTHLPSGSPVDPTTRLVLRNSLDSVGVRTRAKIMADVVTRHHEQSGLAGGSWISLACGAAVPVLDARAALPAGTRPHLTLVDIDPASLDHARHLAGEQGASEGVDLTVLQRDLVRGIVGGTSLLDELGEGSADAVEALGIFEYFGDGSAVRLLRNAHRLLAPGGVLVIGNMLADRPELVVNQRGFGWPKLYPRSVDALLDLVARAGLPLDRTTVSIPADGVYAVVDITRPAD